MGPALPDTRPKDLSGREGRGQHAWGSHKLDGTGTRAWGGAACPSRVAMGLGGL